MNTSKPTLSDVIAQAIERGIAQVRTCMPAVLEAYDSSNQTATISLSVCEKRFRQGGEFPEDYAVKPIANVPVWLPGTSSGHFYVAPQHGDTGLALFCHRSIAEWKAVGGRDVCAQQAHRFQFSDAIFIPGIAPFANRDALDRPSNATLIDHQTEVRLGKNAVSKVALATLTDAQLSSMATALNLFITLYNAAAVAGGGPLTVAPGTPPILAVSLSSVAASKVTAE